MKKIFAFIVIAAMVFNLGACSSGTTTEPETDPKDNGEVVTENETVAMVPGTYSSTVPSMKGDMTVHVTVDENAITEINIDTVDTIQIVDAIVNDLIPVIVEKQSINIDSISGATISSAALKTGVKNCLTEAGADIELFNEDFSVERTKGDTEEKTVVVVGSGAAGLSTAIQLAKAGVEDVIVLEKLGYYGGTTGFSSGGAWVVGGSEFNEMTGYDYTADELIEFMYTTTGAERGTLNEGLIRNIAEVSSDVFTEYVDLGAPWDLTQYTFGDSLNAMPVAWPSQFYDTPWENGAGITLINFLVETAEDNGVEIRLNSKVTSLLSQDGAVTGVVVEDQEKEYEINAKKVVLATGGFQRNRELVEELAGEYVDMIPFTGAGSTGDGIVMAKELGADTAGYGIGGARGLDERHGYQGPTGVLVWNVGPVVNKDGVRFAAETVHYSYVPSQIVSQPEAVCFGITDSTNGMLDYLEEAVELGYVAKADTLEELAEQMGVKSNAFVETISNYNTAYEEGVDDPDFGVSNSALSPVLEAPFYGVKIKAVSSFSLAGLKASEYCEILKEDGQPIPNLYGAGELICGNLFYGTYSGSGSQVGAGLYEGRIIADVIAKELNIE